MYYDMNETKRKDDFMYKLVIQTDSYTGNFERELISYAIGILDEEQMYYSPEYSEKFWEEEFNIENHNIEDLPKEYDLYNEYLEYSYEMVDDWHQEIFYNIGNSKNSKLCDSIFLYLKKPLNEKWENIIIPRIKKFFDKDVRYQCENKAWTKIFHEAKDKSSIDDIRLIELYLIDENEDIIKRWDVK